MLVYVTLKPANVVFGLDQETVREDSVTLLKTISVAGSGPGGRKKHGRNFIHKCTLHSFLPMLIMFLMVVEKLCIINVQ